MKKNIALFLSFLMILSGLSCSAPAFAEADGPAGTEESGAPALSSGDTAYLQARDFLSGLGIIEEDDSIGGGEGITVAEFSRWVVSASGGFDPYHVESSLAVPLTNANAAKLLVTALGYVNLAQGQGGFPIGYVSVAVSKGLYKNVSVKGVLARTRRNATVMLYNAMTAALARSVDVGADPRYAQVTEGETLLSRFLKQKGVAVFSGQVMQTPVSSLIGRSALSGSRNQVDIDGAVYNLAADASCTGLLGRQVLAFAYADEYGNPETVYKIVPRAGKNKTMRLQSRDITNYSDFTYQYQSEGKRESKLTVDKNVSVIYNGVGLSGIAAPDLEVLNGTLTLLDSQGSGSYDVVLIDEYSNYLVSAVEAEKETLVFRQSPFEEKWSMKIHSDDQDYVYYFMNKKTGKTAAKRYEKGDLAFVAPNDVVSIFRSRDKKIITLAITDGTVEGRIDALAYGDGSVTLDGQEYSLFEYAKEIYLTPEGDLPIGERVRLYADVHGQIAFSDAKPALSEDEGNAVSYAYVIDLAQKSGLAADLQLKLLHGTVLRAKETDASKENDLSVEKDPAKAALAENQIYGQSVDVKTCAKHVRFSDGDLAQQSVGAERLLDSLKGRLIQYTVNHEGLINKIRVLYGDERDRRYDDAEKTFSDRTPSGAFMVSDKTVFIVVPSTAKTDEDYEVRYSVVDSTFYRTAPYDLQRAFHSDFDTASVCLIRAASGGHRAGIITEDTQISIVTGSGMALDENGDTMTKVHAYTGGVLRSYLMREDPYVLKAPSVGSIVKLSLDGDNKIDGYVTLMDGSDTGMPLFRIGARTNNERFYGKAYDKRQDILQGLTGKVVKQIDVSYLEDFSEILTLDVSALLEKQIYLYDRARDKITLGDYTDILTVLSGEINASEVFLAIKAGEIRGMVIFK